MSVFKVLDSSGVFVTDYVSRKEWNLKGDNLKGLGVQYIKAYSGSFDTELPFYPGYESSSCYVPGIMYESIKHNYYSGSLTGVEVTDPETGQKAYYDGLTTGSVNLSLQTTITVSESRCLPTESYSTDNKTTIVVYSIPVDYYGFNIQEGTFKLSPVQDLMNYVDTGYVEEGYFEQTLLGDTVDSEGVLLYSGYDGSHDEEGRPVYVQNKVIGDIVYNQGMIFITDPYQAFVYSKYTCDSLHWRSNVPIHTQNVKCVIRDSEFNYTYNPTAKQFVGDNKLPIFITSIGLYNSAGELLAVAKLSKPIRKMNDIDMTIVVRVDIS